MTGRREWTAAVALTLAAAAFHVERMLRAGGLWRDEAGAAALALQPHLRDVLRTFPHEAFPPLFPALVRGWAALAGPGDASLRAFGLAVGLALLAALWCNAWLLGRGVPLLGIAFLGFDAAAIRYGDSLRGYGLGAALLVASFGLLGRSLAEAPGPRSRRWLLAAGAAALLAVNCLLQTAALVAALAAAAALVHLRRGRRRDAALVLGGLLAVEASLLPYTGAFAAARRWSVVVIYPLRAGEVWKALAEALGGPPLAGLWILVFALGALGAVGAVGAVRRPRRASPAGAGEAELDDERAGTDAADTALYVLLSVLFAVAAQGVFLAVLRYSPRPWYDLPLAALLASALDPLANTAISAIALPGVRAARLAFAVVLGAVLVLPAWTAVGERATNVDRIARAIAENAGRGDFVIVNPWTCGVSFARYYAGSAPWQTLPALADHRFHRYDLMQERMRSEHPIDDVLAAAGAALASGHRVWVVGGVHLPRAGEVVEALPPAPRSAWGWHDIPYSLAWSRQLGAFLAARARRAATVEVGARGRVSPNERLPLLVFDGGPPP
jgi:hypothetical protein